MFKNTIQDLQNELQNKEGSRSWKFYQFKSSYRFIMILYRL